MWAAVFATSNAKVVLQCGSSSSTFSVTRGVNKLKIPLSPGAMTVKMTRNGRTIINESSQNYSYVLNPTLCAFFFFFFFFQMVVGVQVVQFGCFRQLQRLGWVCK